MSLLKLRGNDLDNCIAGTTNEPVCGDVESIRRAKTWSRMVFLCVSPRVHNRENFFSSEIAKHRSYDARGHRSRTKAQHNSNGSSVMIMIGEFRYLC